MSKLGRYIHRLRHDANEALWHHAYCRWYDERAAGHPRRAAAWGRLADGLVRFV